MRKRPRLPRGTPQPHRFAHAHTHQSALSFLTMRTLSVVCLCADGLLHLRLRVDLCSGSHAQLRTNQLDRRRLLRSLLAVAVVAVAVEIEVAVVVAVAAVAVAVKHAACAVRAMAPRRALRAGWKSAHRHHQRR